MNFTTTGKRLLRNATPLDIGFIAIATLILAGCGGDEGGSTLAASTLSGVAAVGYPIIGGNINTRCATGSALTTTTSNTGGWQVTLSDQSLPCAVQVSGGTINGTANATLYHAIAMATGTVNVTPLTDLMVANLARTATPSLWFDGLSPAMLTATTQTQVDAALTNVRTALGLTPLNTLNPITTAFAADSGNISDDMLNALTLAMTNASVTYSTLLGNASASTFVAPTGFGTALTTAYSSTTSGGGISLPAVPTMVTATTISSTQINVNWTSVSGASSYNIYRSNSTNVQIIAGNKITTATASPYSDTGLSASTAYYYKVTAINAAGETSGSTETSATTSAAGAATPTITSFAPSSGAAGSTITVTGTNFSTTAASNTVSFNGVQATVTSATATQLSVMVPATANTGNITVTVGGQAATSATSFTVSGVGSALTVTGPTLEMGSAVCGITSTSAAYCWGFGGNGETGNAAGSSNVPVAVQGGLSFATISTFGPHTCALTAAGDAYCWGSGSLGALGDGNANGHIVNTPTAVVGGLKFKAITVGNNFTCALVADGTAYCWGNNGQGQLGLGAPDAKQYATPTQMPNFKWQSISAQDEVACGINTAGAAYCWGWSSGVIGSGALGLVPVGVPTAVPGGVTLKSVVTSSMSSACGLASDGKAYCWGVGTLGTGLGFGSTILGETAVVGGLTFTQLAGSKGRFCGITAAGATYCWGTGFGDTPVAVAAGIVAREVATRGVATCVVSAEGVASCFGSNFLGELGDGTNTTRTNAVPVSGSLTFKLP